MSRSRALEPHISDPELVELAKRYVKNLMENDRVRKATLQALQRPSLQRELLSAIDNMSKGEEGGTTPPTLFLADQSWNVRFALALKRRDFQQMLQLTLASLRAQPPSREQASLLREITTTRGLRKAVLVGSQSLKGPRGRPPKASAFELTELPGRADKLLPVIRTLLQARGMARSAEEWLNFLRKDYPEACEYLLAHIEKLETALNSKWLSKRASTPKGLARLISDALAGAESELSLRTSIERVGQERRKQALSTTK